RENAPAGFEVIRANAQGKVEPLAQAQMRLFREEIAVRPQFDSDVARENAPAGFEVIRANAQGKVEPLAQAQMRLFREE
ncbi:hypothetical protein CTI14_68970, partial [Methylobacterium radiotolerans]